MTMTMHSDSDSARLDDEVLVGSTIWVTTTDHRRIGRMYIVSSFFFGVAFLLLGLLVAVERFDSETLSLFTADIASPLAASVRIGLAFFVAAPLFLGLGIAVAPLQIGAENIAFPRAALLSFSLWLGGALLTSVALLAGGGPGGTNDKMVLLFLLGLGVGVLGLLLAAVCVSATVMTRRAPGMGLLDTPFFSFAQLVSSSVLVLSGAALLANVLNLYASFRFGNVPYGDATTIMRHLEWAVSQTGVVVFVLPLLGFFGDIVVTASGSRQPYRQVFYSALAFAGFLAFAADLQRGWNTESPYQPITLLANLGVLLPFSVVFVLGLMSLKSKKKSRAVSVLPAWIALSLGLFAAIAGVVLVLKPLELLNAQGASVDGKRLSSATIFLSTQSTVMLVASILGGCGALAYWGPRLWNRTLQKKSVSLVITLGFLGALFLLAGEGAAAFSGLPLDEVVFSASLVSQSKAIAAILGYALIASGFVGFIFVALRGFGSGARVGIDPWDGQTLEWAEFPHAGAIVSPEPLLDRKDA
jgi:heme/copper-type cytochrome/quinol oxidase subunit 1